MNFKEKKNVQESPERGKFFLYIFNSILMSGERIEIQRM